MIRFSSKEKKKKKKKKQRLSKSLSFSMWVTCWRSKLSLIIIIIILSKLSLGKENISYSYAVMPNYGRKSEQWGRIKRKKNCGRRESISESMQCQFGLRGQNRGVEGSRIKLAKNRLVLGQFYFILLPLPLPRSKRTIIASYLSFFFPL